MGKNERINHFIAYLKKKKDATKKYVVKGNHEKIVGTKKERKNSKWDENTKKILE